MTLEEYTRSLHDKPRHFKVKGSLGVYDVYKMVRKKGWGKIGKHISESEFFGVVRQVNKLLAKEMAEGNAVVFPMRMGKLELRKTEKGVSFVNGKLKITYPIAWKDTIELWYNDKEARENKTLVRNENRYVYTIWYDKYGAKYENMSFYKFTTNQFIKRALAKNIKEGKIDSLW